MALDIMKLLEGALTGGMQNSVASGNAGITEADLASAQARIGEVYVPVNAALGRVENQVEQKEVRAAEAMQELDAQTEQAKVTLNAVLGKNAAEQQLAEARYVSEQEKLADRDRENAVIKQTSGLSQAMDILKGNIPEKLQQVDIASDSLSRVNREIDETSNPLEWLLKQTIVKPYYQKKVAERRNEIAQELSTTGRVLQFANAAQVSADNFRAGQDPDHLKAAVFNFSQAQSIAMDETARAQYRETRVKSVLAKYGFDEDKAKDLSLILNANLQIANAQSAVKTAALAARLNRGAGSASGDGEGDGSGGGGGGKGGSPLGNAKKAVDLLKGVQDIYKAQADLGAKWSGPEAMGVLQEAGYTNVQLANMPEDMRGRLLNSALFQAPLIATGVPMTTAEAVTELDKTAAVIRNLPGANNQLVMDTVLRSARRQLLDYSEARAKTPPTLLGTPRGGPADAKEDDLLKGARERATLFDIVEKVGADGTITPIITLRMDRALNTPMRIEEPGGEPVVKSVTSWLADSIQRPGSALGKTVLSSPEILKLIRDKKPGGKLAANLVALVNSKDALGHPVFAANTEVSYDRLLDMAGGPMELLAFTEALKRGVGTMIPYSAIGADPAPIQPSVKYELYTRPNSALDRMWGPQKITEVAPLPSNGEQATARAAQLAFSKKFLQIQQQQKLGAEENAAQNPGMKFLSDNSPVY